MSAQGGEMKAGVEEFSGLRAVELTHKEFAELVGAIRGLKYDAKDPDKNRAPGAVRKRDLAGMKLRMDRAGEHLSFFCAMEGDEIVGFLAVERHQREGYADIQDLWTDERGQRQRKLASYLVAAAKQKLIGRGISELRTDSSTLDAPNSGGFLRRAASGDGEDALHATEWMEPANDDIPSSESDIDEAA